MAANVKVIRARDFVRAQPGGHANLEQAEQLLKDIALAVWRLAERLVRFRKTFAHRNAILCPIEKFDHTRFFALCAENHGFNIQAFSSYEEAMEWLLDG
jgi:hypothetical protein